MDPQQNKSMLDAPAPKASAAVDDFFCQALELVAFAIHPGNTQSTTTLCLNPATQEVILTSQGNLRFETVTVEFLHGTLDGLIAALVHRDVGRFWLEHCAIAVQRNDFRTQRAKEKEEREVNRLYNDLYGPLFRACIEKYNRSSLERLKGMFWRVAVVLNEHLFGGAVVTTGVHGESRIVRRLYITYVELWMLERQYGPGDLAKFEVEANADFTAYCKRLRLIMASSQPTCAHCGEYLDGLGIAHGDTGHRSPNWTHPITMRTLNSGFPPPARLHAACFQRGAFVFMEELAKQADESGFIPLDKFQ